MGRFKALAVGLFLLVLLLSGCSPKEPGPWEPDYQSQEGAAAEPSATASASAPAAPKAAGAGTGSRTASQRTISPSEYMPDELATRQYTAKIDASLSPACVGRGGTVTLNVHMTPESAVAYQAFYADGNSGAVHPWGKGYGGNDAAQTDKQGNKTFTWVVSATAPIGPGRVDVYGATPYQEWGRTSLVFKVAQPGDC